ncbi:hypothetical protein BHE74_00049876 [Ensete ventricosum]|nr:hypothetical protein BHE74_00049876 [Ensete ventricosum]
MERSNGQRSSSGREEMGCRSVSLVVRCDIAGPIATKQRKNERKQSNGYFDSIYCMLAGRRKQEAVGPWAGHGTWSIRGRRVCRSICRAEDRWCQCAGALARLETGEATGMGDFTRDLFRRNKGCQGCGNSINARWEIGADLIGSVGSGRRCRDSRWTGVNDKICTRPEAVETCCHFIARRELALSKLISGREKEE